MNTTEFKVGDKVNVLDPFRLPNEVIKGTGVIDRITMSGNTKLYWVSGFPIAREAKVLRHA